MKQCSASSRRFEEAIGKRKLLEERGPVQSEDTEESPAGIPGTRRCRRP